MAIKKTPRPMPAPRPSEDRRSPHAHPAAVHRYEALRDAKPKKP